MDETELEKLARLSGRVASKAIDALERRGYDIRGKMSAPYQQNSPSHSSEARIGRLNAVSNDSATRDRVQASAFMCISAGAESSKTRPDPVRRRLRPRRLGMLDTYSRQAPHAHESQNPINLADLDPPCSRSPAISVF